MAQNKPSLHSCFCTTLLFLFILSGSLSSPVQAQTTIEDAFTKPTLLLPDSTIAELSLLVKDTAPNVPKHPRFLKNVAYVAAGAATWMAAYEMLDEPLQQFSQENRTTVASTVARVVEPLGRQKNWAPVAGAALLGGVVFKNQKLQKAGILSLGSIMVNGVVTHTLKTSFGRHRPSITTENDKFDEPFSNSRNTSLPSSHTSTAFAVATSVATVYKDHKLVPPIAYGVATLVGLSRINDNMHWASDVVAGAAVGYLSAKVVNKLYDIASQKIRARQQKLYFTPQVGSSSATMNMTLVF